MAENQMRMQYIQQPYTQPYTLRYSMYDKDPYAAHYSDPYSGQRSGYANNKPLPDNTYGENTLGNT